MLLLGRYCCHSPTPDCGICLIPDQQAAFRSAATQGHGSPISLCRHPVWQLCSSRHGQQQLCGAASAPHGLCWHCMARCKVREPGGGCWGDASPPLAARSGAGTRVHAAAVACHAAWPIVLVTGTGVRVFQSSRSSLFLGPAAQHSTGLAGCLILTPPPPPPHACMSLLQLITKLFPNRSNVYAKGPVGENVLHVAMLLNTPSTLAITRFLVKMFGAQLVNTPIQVWCMDRARREAGRQAGSSSDRQQQQQQQEPPPPAAAAGSRSVVPPGLQQDCIRAPTDVPPDPPTPVTLWPSHSHSPRSDAPSTTPLARMRARQRCTLPSSTETWTWSNSWCRCDCVCDECVMEV